MKNQKQTIRKIVGFLNNPEEDGGFWLPNIQRPFVWSEDQICRLFDSILREYPISTFLIWKTTSGIRRRNFIANWKNSLKLSDFYEPEDDSRKSLVLDGQQRLQSLFIGLKGSFEKKELYLNILSGELAAPDDVKYQFKFLQSSETNFPWIKFKELIFDSKKKREWISYFKDLADNNLTDKELDKLEDHLDVIDRTFKIDEAITYQVLDSIDDPTLYTEDDVVEVFIRANSGGTKLGKSDLLFSLLSASWEVADEKMDDLLESLNCHGFAFDRDFILKTCLVLLGQGARYEVEKFRKQGVREDIEKNWKNISKAIKDVLDFIRGKTFIKCDKALPSYLILMPLIYFRYHFKEAWRQAQDLDDFILRCSLTNAFSSHSDSMIDALVKRIAETESFDVDTAFTIVKSQGKNLELTEERFWLMGYGSKTIHLLFNMWYRDFNHTPAYENNLPQIDHIFPQSALRKIKTENPKTGRKDILKYPSKERDQLANCMLLSMEENGRGGKSAILPEVWFKDKNPNYLKMHLIPTDPELWKLDAYEEFLEARKALIRERFKSLLSSS